MKILAIIIALMTWTMTSCQSDADRSETLEKEICQCIYEEFDSIHVDLKTELLKYEQYLVENHLIGDKTGESYLQVFQQIVAQNEFPFQSSFSIDHLSLDYKDILRHCISTNIDTLEGVQQDPKILSFHTRIDSLKSLPKEDQQLSELASFFLSTFKAEDIDRPLIKMSILYYFHKSSTPSVTNKAFINIKITDDNKYYINNHLIALDSIAFGINQIIENLPEAQRDSFFIDLTVGKNVIMRQVIDVKTQIRKAADLRDSGNN